MAETLRTGVVASASGVHAWEAAMLRQLARIGKIQATLLIDDQIPAETPPLAYRLFERFDNRIFGMADDPLAIVSPDSGLPRMPVSRCPEAEFDLLILLSAVQRRSEALLRLGRHGALMVTTLDAEGRALNPPGYWEVMRSMPVSRIGVRWLTPDGGDRLVGQTCSSTAHFSPRRNREPLLWTAPSLIPRLVRHLQPEQLGKEKPFPDATLAPEDRGRLEETLKPAHVAIGNGAAALSWEAVSSEAVVGGYPPARRLARHLVAKTPDLFRFYYHAKLTREQWYLMFQFSDHPGTDLTRFSAVIPPADRIWADPHILKRQGRYHVFIEEMLFAENKGFISVLEIGEDGHYSQPVKVLERPYHLSYPQVFEWRGELYMLPETSANRTIELYRCERFPDRWRLQRVLMDDIDAVDASLLHENGRWWLFCAIKPHPAASENDELHLFHSDDLLTGDWKPHPRNPVVSDVRYARPAGKPYRHLGRRIRPSQNCAGIYGHGFNLNVITQLDENRYREEPLVSVTADQYPGLIGTHTYAREGRLTVVDACRRIPRRPTF